jgi:hypothetical protein
MTREIWSKARRLSSAAHERMSAIIAGADSALDETDKQYLAAAMAGVSAGTLVVLIFGIAGFGAGAVALFVGTFFVSALYRRWTGLLGVLTALFCWYVVISAGLAPPAQGEYTQILAAIPLYIFLLGCLAAAIAYPIGLPFRPKRDWQPLRIPTVVAGVVSVLALVAGLVVAPPVPAGSSFSITLPPGWSAHQMGDSTRRPFFCKDYVAVYGTGMSDDAIAQDLRDDQPPTTPWICASVVRADESGTGTHWCSLASTTQWLYGWSFRESASTPPVAESDELMGANSRGDRFFGLSAWRSRAVGPVGEQVCYTLAAVVPAGSKISDADVGNIFSTFRFR